MDTAKEIKKLRESTGMNRREFSQHTSIPVRTLEDWEASRRTPPEYIPRLISYQLKYEELSETKKKSKNEIILKLKDKDDKRHMSIQKCL